MRRKKKKSTRGTTIQRQKRKKRRSLRRILKGVMGLFNSPKPVDLTAEYPNGWS